MPTPGRTNRTTWIIIAASTIAGCATQPASLALTPSLPSMNASPLLVGVTSSAETPVRERGEISLAESQHYTTVQELLIARAPGLDVRPLGTGQFSLLVRGRPALTDGHEPLVVIDGIQFAQNGADVLAGMTPRDIKRIEVLRDAASAGIYGSRGAGGVVVVTSR
jgi:TonB-dependent SusC/RagA subfamily outer membrane receptor